MGRNVETERIASLICGYLDGHEAGDPACASLRNEDLAGRLKIAKRHLSNKTDPELSPLSERLARLKARLTHGQSEPAASASEAAVSIEASIHSTSRPAPDPELTLEDLARDIARRKTDAVYRLKQWLAYYESPGEVLDSPAMLADLDSLVGGLRRLSDELRPLVSAVNRHRASVPDLLTSMPLYPGGSE